MQQFEKQGGIAFFLIFYSHKDLLYYLPYEMLRFFWDRANDGGRKSFRFEELNPEYVIPSSFDKRVALAVANAVATQRKTPLILQIVSYAIMITR